MTTLLATSCLLLSVGCDSEGGDDPAGMMAGETAGETPAGETPAGETPAGETPAGETPAGEDPAGEDPAGEDPAGEDPAGEDPAGETPMPTLCDNYCDAVMMNCTDDNAQFESRDECMTFCADLPEGTEGDTAGDSASCRLYHAGDPASEDPATHCPHAGVDGGGVCVDITLCDTYCDTIMMNCVDDNAQFESRDACMTFCADLPEGTEGDVNGNSVQCRIYHGSDPSALDPDFHCMHAGEDGGNVCVDTPPTPCDRFCANVVESCTGDYQVYENSEACLSACEGFSPDGNFGDASGDTIQCRDRHAQLAFNDPVLGLAAAPDGGGVCVNDDTPRQIDRMGRPAINTALITADHKDLYNFASNDQGIVFVPEMAALLEVIDGLDGNLANGLASLFGDTPDFVALADFLSQDVLLYNSGIENCEGGYLAAEVALLLGVDQTNCGGRTLSQDVMDVTLQVLVDVTLLTGNPDAVVVTDAVGENDKPFSADFPYLAAPRE